MLKFSVLRDTQYWENTENSQYWQILRTGNSQYWHILSTERDWEILHAGNSQSALRERYSVLRNSQYWLIKPVLSTENLSVLSISLAVLTDYSQHGVSLSTQYWEILLGGQQCRCSTSQWYTSKVQSLIYIILLGSPIFYSDHKFCNQLCHLKKWFPLSPLNMPGYWSDCILTP